MSEHSEIVHSYIELRNFLATSHPKPNMKFEIGFVINEQSLLAFSSVSKSSVEVAKIQPIYSHLYIPNYGLRFESYSLSLIEFINDSIVIDTEDVKANNESIVYLCLQHRKSLDLKIAYEPRN